MARTPTKELGQGDSNYSVGITIQLYVLVVFKKSCVISSRALKAIHIPHNTLESVEKQKTRVIMYQSEPVKLYGPRLPLLYFSAVHCVDTLRWRKRDSAARRLLCNPDYTHCPSACGCNRWKPGHRHSKRQARVIVKTASTFPWYFWTVKVVCGLSF
jgi:hypothetical protein